MKQFNQLDPHTGGLMVETVRMLPLGVPECTLLYRIKFLFVGRRFSSVQVIYIYIYII